MTANPWYREPWPWLLMAGPALVVVAGIFTAALAVRSFDGMVADDYYKEGLGVNREIAREERAAALGIQARVQFDAERGRVRVFLAGNEQPPTVTLRVVHPTLVAQDRVATLARSSPGVYEAAMDAPRGRSVHLRIEDAGHRWLVRSQWNARQARP